MPPHPGPLLAIATLKADLGLTLAFGLVLAIPAVVLARPVYGSFISRYLDLPARRTLFAPQASRELAALGSGGTSTTVAGAPDDLDAVEPTPAPVRRALLTGTIVAMFTPGVGSCMSRERIAASLGGALGPIAGILLIVAAGGGFKQTPVDAGVGNVIADWATGANISALLLGWLVAVGIRPAALVASGTGLRRSWKPRPEDREELGAIYRLGYVVVGSGVEAALALADRGFAGDGNDGN